jgi:hypothetical protein
MKANDAGLVNTDEVLSSMEKTYNRGEGELSILKQKSGKKISVFDFLSDVVFRRYAA